MAWTESAEGAAVTTRKLIPIKQESVDQQEQAEDRLLRQGWRRITTIGEPRLSEIVETYKTLGYDVHVEAWKTEGEDCTSCLDEDQATGKVLGTVYTRRSETGPKEDELF